MADFEGIKKPLKPETGIATPGAAELDELLHPQKPIPFRFRDDGFIPNHPRWPVLLYQACVRLPQNRDPAAVFEALFTNNHWGRSWRAASMIAAIATHCFD